MKYLIAILLLVFIMAFTGTTSNHYVPSGIFRDTVPTGAAPQLFGGKLYEFKNYTLIDSFLMVMAGDTFAIPRWPAITYKSSDNRWYGYHGTRWRAFLNGLDTVSLSNRIDNTTLNVTSQRLLGRYASNDGVVQEIQIGDNLTLDSTTGHLNAVGIDSSYIIGPMYDSSAWGNTSSFTVTGSPTINSNKIRLPAGGTELNWIYGTMLEQETLQVDFKYKTLASNDSAFTIGWESNNPPLSLSLYGRVSTSTGKVRIYTVLNGSTVGNSVLVSSSDLTGGISVDDSLTYTFYRNKDTTIFTVRNNTTGHIGHATSVRNFQLVGETGAFHNTAFFSMVNSASTTNSVELCRVKYSSSALKQPIAALLGNSISSGSFAEGVNNRFGEIIKSIICAGSGDISASGVQQIYSLVNFVQPQNIFIMLGGNDILAGLSADTWQTNLATLHDSLVTCGTNVYWLLATPRNATNITPLNDWIKAAYPYTYIDTYTPLWSGSGTGLNPIYDSGDGVHLNVAGNAKVAETIMGHYVYKSIENIYYRRQSRDILYKTKSLNVASDGSVLMNSTVSNGLGKLQVFGQEFIKDSTNGNHYLIAKNYQTGSNAQTNIRAQNNNDDYAQIGTFSTSTTSNGVLAAGGAYLVGSPNAGLAISAAAGPVKFSANGFTEKMRLSTGGNLLIGTTTDNSTGVLQLESSTANIASFKSTAAANAIVDFMAAAGRNMNFRFGQGGAFKWYVQNNTTADDFRLLNSDANGNAQMFNIRQNGEVNIGNFADQGAFTLQNTGGLYQSGVVTLNLGSDATGDIYYRNSGGSLTRLGVGSNGNVLTLASGIPSWAAPTTTLQQAITNGSTLSSPNTIAAGTNAQSFTGTNPSAAAYTFSNTGNGNAVSMTATGSGPTALISNTSTGIGLQITSADGTALNVTSDNSTAASLNINPSSTNTTEQALTITRRTTGTAANNIGVSAGFQLEDDAGITYSAGLFKVVATSAATASRTTSILLSTVNAGASNDRLILDGPGQLRLSAYGAGTFTGTPTGSIQTTSNGTLIEGPIVAAGTYTPTLTSVANVAASTAFSCQYMRVGNTVTVSGRVDIDPTGTGATSLGITLPIASALANNNECGGTGSVGTAEGLQGSVSADATNDRAQLDIVIPAAGSVANNSWFFSFTYRIL